MTLAVQFFVGLAVSLGLVVLLGFFLKRRYNFISFFWGNRDLRPGIVASLFCSTSYSLNGVLYQTWLGYDIGIASLWIQAAWCASFLLLALRPAQVSKLSRLGTLHGFIGESFGRYAEVVAATASILGLTSLIGWELVVAASLFKSVGVEQAALFTVVAGLAIAAAVYTIRGGLLGNAKINLAQNIFAGLTWLVAIGYLYFTLSKTDDGGTFSVTDSHRRLLTQLGIFGLLTNIVFSLSWQFVDMTNWQSISATERSSSSVSWSLIGGAALVFFFPGFVGAIAGMVMARTPGLSADTIIPKMVEAVSGNALVGTLLLAGFFSAMMSTLDGYFLGASQALAWDIWYRKKVGSTLKALVAMEEAKDPTTPALQREEQLIQSDLSLGTMNRGVLLVSKVFILAVAMVGGLGIMALHNWKPDLDLFKLVYIAVVAQLPLFPVVALLIWRPQYANRFPGTASIIGGLSAGAICVIAGLLTNTAWLLDSAGTAAVIAAAGIGLLLMLRRRQPSH